MPSDSIDLGFVVQSLNRGEPASDIRENLLKTIVDAADLDACVYFLLAGPDSSADADYQYTAVHAVGETSLAKQLRLYDGKSMTCDSWDPAHPQSDSTDRFLTTRLAHRDHAALPEQLVDEVSGYDANSAIRILVYDDEGVFAGGIVGLRCDEAGFGPNEMRTLRRLESDVRDIMIGLEQRRREIPPLGTGQLLFRHLSPPKLEAHSSGADTWLNAERKKQLRQWIAYAEDESSGSDQPNPALRLISSEPERWEGLLDGYLVRLTPLEGPDGPKILADVSHANLPRKGPLAPLTPRQREVAHKAASGMTNREIADALEITPDTVGDHLSAIYDRLDLANRVELANHISQ